jgi:DnaJ like chaperone protein
MWKLILLILAGLYTLNPYDLFPDLIVGWGWIDDLIVWGLLWRYLLSQKNKYSNYQRFYKRPHDFFENKQGHYSSGQQGSGPKFKYTDRTAAWDPYQVLGIDPKASPAEIKKAYRELVNKYHPDKLEHLGDEFKQLAEMRFKDIQKAYEELSKKGP